MHIQSIYLYIFQCIAIQDKWAKGHVRLASAYMALGGHSNDACNALQRAVSLDPSNQTARQMLIQELKRRDAPHQQQQQPPPPHHAPNANRAAAQDDVDERLSVKERIQLYWIRTVTWYHSQPEDVQTLLKVMAGIVVLYVMFGGRFGLEGFGSRPLDGKGHAYGRGRHGYDRYGTASDTTRYNTYVQQQQQQQPRGSGIGEAATQSVPTDNVGPEQSANPDMQDASAHGGTGEGQPNNIPDPNTAGAGRSHQPDPDTSNTQQRRTTAAGYDDDYDYQPNTRSTSSFQFPNLFDGSFPSIICLLGIAYICHRNGINPFQAFMMMNMMGAGRRGMGYGGMGYGGMGMGGMGYGGMGMGMAGMGYGMARNAGVFGGGQPARPRPGHL